MELGKAFFLGKGRIFMHPPFFFILFYFLNLKNKFFQEEKEQNCWEETAKVSSAVRPADDDTVRHRKMTHKTPLLQLPKIRTGVHLFVNHLESIATHTTQKNCKYLNFV